MRNVAKIGLVIALLGAAAACSKAGPGTVAGAASSAIDVLPKDTAVVFGFNAAKFRESKLWGMMQGMMPAESKTNLEAVKSICGIDAMTDFESVVIASGGDLSEDKMVFIVKGKWEQDKLDACVGPLGEKLGKKKILVEKDGKLTSYAPEGEKKAWVAWIDKNTMIMTGPSLQGDKASLSDLLAAKSSIKDNKDLMALVGKVDTTATIWGAGFMPTNSNVKGMSAQIQTDKKENVQGGWMSIQFGKALDGAMGLRFDQAANGVVDKVAKELEGAKANPQIGKFLAGSKLTADGNDMVFTVKLDEKQIDELMTMMQQGLPMLMQMIGG